MKLNTTLNENRLPRHVAIIMDGNGRWAQQRKRARVFGHRQGSRTARKLVLYAANNLHIRHLTLYTFSKENWNRPRREVNALMSLLIEALNKGLRDLLNNDIRLNIIGDLHQLPPVITKKVTDIMDKSRHCKKMVVHLALNYSARWEIIEATKKIARAVKDNTLKLDDIDSEYFSKHLTNYGAPYPEVFIRTGGEYRISNFLLWQIAYTELFFTQTLWPDFSKNEFLKILQSYQCRERRFGLTSSQIKNK